MAPSTTQAADAASKAPTNLPTNSRSYVDTAPPPAVAFTNQSLLVADRFLPEGIAAGVSVAASTTTTTVVAATAAASLVPSVVGTVAAAASAGSMSSGTAALSAAPKVMSTAAKGTSQRRGQGRWGRLAHRA